MKVYFGLVDEDTLEFFYDTDLFYVGGDYYYFCMEYGSNPGGLEEVSITDTCGRTMPVSLEHIEALQEALTVALEANATLVDADTLRENLENEYSITGLGI